MLDIAYSDCFLAFTEYVFHKVRVDCVEFGQVVTDINSKQTMQKAIKKKSLNLPVDLFLSFVFRGKDLTCNHL